MEIDEKTWERAAHRAAAQEIIRNVNALKGLAEAAELGEGAVIEWMNRANPDSALADAMDAASILTGYASRTAIRERVEEELSAGDGPELSESELTSYVKEIGERHQGAAWAQGDQNFYDDFEWVLGDMDPKEHVEDVWGIDEFTAEKSAAAEIQQNMNTDTRREEVSHGGR